MRKTEKEIIERTRCVSILCDCCKKEYTDAMEVQEFLCFYTTGGFLSVFGDEALIELDLCQYCVAELLGKYIRIGKEKEDGRWKK